jgi:hypothetical protein
VKSEIESLRASKKAFHFEGFVECMLPYTRKHADEIRQRSRAAKDRTAGRD